MTRDGEGLINGGHLLLVVKKNGGLASFVFVFLRVGLYFLIFLNSFGTC